MGSIHTIVVYIDWNGNGGEKKRVCLCVKERETTTARQPFIYRFKLKCCDQVSSAVQRFIPILYEFIVVLVGTFFCFWHRISEKSKHKSMTEIASFWFDKHKNNFFHWFSSGAEQLIAAREFHTSALV